MAQLITVRLSRVDAQPWGLRLQGGKDFGTPLVVQKVSFYVILSHQVLYIVTILAYLKKIFMFYQRIIDIIYYYLLWTVRSLL